MNESAFSISVVIPFYNAREFVTQAVESALQQPETGEVIVIEDGSPDGGIEILKELETKYPKVRLLRHPDNANHGAASSRKLGIQNARHAFIAFLDADDYYLPGRFTATSQILCNDPSIDGVYNAMGTYFETAEDRKLFNQTFLREITTVTKKIAPEKLFEEIIGLKSTAWYFHLNSLTVKKDLLYKVGLFNERLSPHEDTDMLFKLCAVGRLSPGDIENPVAIRRVHGANRITHHIVDRRKHYQTDIETWDSIYSWGINNLNRKKQVLISLRYIDRLRKSDYFPNHRFKDFKSSREKMVKLAMRYPEIILNFWFWRLVIPSKSLIKRKDAI